MQTKAKIDLKAGVVELEGSEEFVRLHLERFAGLFQGVVYHHQAPGTVVSTPTSQEQPTQAVRKRMPTTKAISATKVTKGPTKTKRIEPTRFDIHKGDSTVSLEDFLKKKKPKSTGDVIAVIGYYITQLKGETTFSEGNIDYAYRALQLKGRPKHLRQIIINNKNQKDLFEQAEDDGAWVLTRAGEIYVDEKLPAKDE